VGVCVNFFFTANIVVCKDLLINVVAYWGKSTRYWHVLRWEAWLALYMSHHVPHVPGVASGM